MGRYYGTTKSHLSVLEYDHLLRDADSYLHKSSQRKAILSVCRGARRTGALVLCYGPHQLCAVGAHPYQGHEVPF